MMPHEILDSQQGRLRVTALDFDGCIERKNDNIQTKQQYLNSEKRLLRFLDANRTDMILSGSNRTNPAIDRHNSEKPPWQYPGASYNVFPWLTTRTRKFNPFLLNDLWAQHEDGRPYDLGDTFKTMQFLFKQQAWKKYILFYNEHYMLNYEKDKTYLDYPDYLDAIWMKDKVNIVYAHIHYLAIAYPNKTITYQLVDDQTDYLYALSYFYNKHHDLVPHNVQIQLIKHDHESDNFSYLHKQTTLHNIFEFCPNDNDKRAHQERRFYQHSALSTDRNNFYTIQGTGSVDKCYQHTVKLLTQSGYNHGLKPHKLEHNWFSSTINVEKFLKTRDELNKKRHYTRLKHGKHLTTFPAQFFRSKEPQVDRQDVIRNTDLWKLSTRL